MHGKPPSCTLQRWRAGDTVLVFVASDVAAASGVVTRVVGSGTIAAPVVTDGQFSSSDASMQSFRPSQTHATGILLWQSCSGLKVIRPVAISYGVQRTSIAGSAMWAMMARYIILEELRKL